MAVEFEVQHSNDSIVELTPLIDVIFQLLVFFMLSSSFLYPSLDIVLPTLSDIETEADSPMLVVNLDAEGNAYINSEPVAMDQLQEMLRLRLAEVEDQAVFLRADEKVEYRLILDIMRKANLAGALQFHFLYQDDAPSE